MCVCPSLLTAHLQSVCVCGWVGGGGGGGAAAGHSCGIKDSGLADDLGQQKKKALTFLDSLLWERLFLLFNLCIDKEKKKKKDIINSLSPPRPEADHHQPSVHCKKPGCTVDESAIWGWS